MSEMVAGTKDPVVNKRKDMGPYTAYGLIGRQIWKIVAIGFYLFGIKKNVCCSDSR